MLRFLRRARKADLAPVAKAAAVALTIVVWDAASGRYLTITTHP